MHRLRLTGPLLLVSLLLALGGCDDTTDPTDGGGSRDAGGGGTDSGTPTDAGRDAGTPIDSGTPVDSGTDAGTATGANVVVGHLGGSSFRLHQFDTASLAATSGSPYTAPGAYNDVAASTAANRIAIALPGEESVVLLDGDTLEAVTTIPVSVDPLTVTFSADGSQLFVYAAEGASNRQMFIFDLSGTTATPVSGSPFAVTFVATSMAHDPTTGRLYGVSATTQWAAEVTASGLTLVGGSTVSGGATSMVIDVARRRYYATRTIPSRIVIRDMDSFDEIGGSPLALPGDFPTGLALEPDTGNLFVLDGAEAGSTQATTLHYVTTSPLAVQDTCGMAAGCTLDATETGIALDPASDRLFISVTRGPAAGQLSVFDVSTPAMPMELSGTRPEVGEVPAWVVVY